MIGMTAPAFTVAAVCASASVSAQALVPAHPPAQSKPQAPVVRAPARPQAAQSAAAAQSPVPQADGEVIARIGSTDIKAESLRAFIAGLGARDQAALARDPALLSQMVRSLLANELVLKEALAKHWDQKPEIAEQIQRAREVTIVDSYLRSVAQPPADFPDEAAIQSAYDANKSAFLVPRQFLLAQIYVALPGGADKAASDKAANKLAAIELKLKQPDANFTAIAKTDSDAKDAAERGGEIGWLLETQLRPEIKALVIGLDKNAVSAPLKLDDGWHILKLIDTKAAYTRPLPEVRAELIQRLRDERAAANRRSYLADLLKQNPPAINELALAKLLTAPAQTDPR